MTAWPSQDRAAMAAFYGDPDPDHDGEPNPAWEAAHLVRIAPAYPMVLAWAPDQPVKTIRCHAKVADSIQRALTRIKGAMGSQEAIVKARLHLYGGCYAFRVMRGGSRLSVHSWGAALDLDPANNPLGKAWKPNAGMMHPAAIEAFEGEGWTWGGRWKSPADAQHFQAAHL